MYLDLSINFKENNEIFFSYKGKGTNFIIKIKFKKLTSSNPYSIDVYFYLTISDKYPEEAPVVTCNTNVFIFYK
jgi:hypothetical protein